MISRCPAAMASTMPWQTLDLANPWLETFLDELLPTLPPSLASGPGANLVSGVIEQNELFHVMGRAIGLIPAPVSED